jgi:hypothetical protein
LRFQRETVSVLMAKLISSPSGWIAGLPPDSDTVTGTPPESRFTSSHTACGVIGVQSSRYRLSTACRLSHHEQR